MTVTRQRIRGFILAALLGVATADSPVPADEPEESSPQVVSWKLQYRFRHGAVVHFHTKSRSNLQVRAREVSQLLRESRETYKHYRVVAVNKDGSAVLEPMIDRAIMQARADDSRPIVWDSRSKAKVPMRFQTVARNVGRPVVRVRYKSNGEVEEVLPISGSKDELKPDAASYGFLVRLPDEAVSIGDSWNDDFATRVTANPEVSRKLQKEVEIRRVYTLKKVKDGVAEIGFDTFVKKLIRDPAIKAQLISRSLTGTVKFDLKRGLILEWASAGSGEVFNPYGSSSYLQSSLSSVEKFVANPQPLRKPVVSTGAPGAAPPPGLRRF